jgi:hypothetical protein
LIGAEIGCKTIAAVHSQCLRWVIRADLARSIESQQVRSTSDSGHKVEPKRPPLCADFVAKVVFHR